MYTKHVLIIDTFEEYVQVIVNILCTRSKHDNFCNTQTWYFGAHTFVETSFRLIMLLRTLATISSKYKSSKQQFSLLSEGRSFQKQFCMLKNWE